MTAKDELRCLVDGLDESEAGLWLAALQDRNPLALTLLTAPYDTEAENDDERSPASEAPGQADVIPDAELWRRLGHAPVRR